MKQQVFEYNILGLDDSASPTHQLEVMKMIASAFADIQRAIGKEVDANLHQKVFGNLSKEETDKILQNYSTVQEGMKHIPGVLSDDIYQNY